MTDPTIATRVRALIARQLGLALDDIREDQQYHDDLSGDSLDAVELMMQLEREFAIHLPDDALSADMTVAQIIETVTQKMQGGGLAV